MLNLDSKLFLEKLNERPIVQLKHLGQQLILEIDFIEPERHVFDEAGEPYFNPSDIANQVRQKLIHFRANSEFEIKKPFIIDHLKNALDLEQISRINKKNKHKAFFASACFSGYLNLVQFKTMIFSTNRIFDLIKPEDCLEGTVDFFENKKDKYLCLLPQSIRFSPHR